MSNKYAIGALVEKGILAVSTLDTISEELLDQPIFPAVCFWRRISDVALQVARKIWH